MSENIRPRLGDVVLDRDGRRAQCIATPTSRSRSIDVYPRFLDTDYVFRRGPGTHWCVDQPTGKILPRSLWTGPERVRAVMMYGRDVLFDFVEEDWRREELFEQTLIEAVLGVDDLRDAFGFWDEPDYVDRWVLLAEEFDRRRVPEPEDSEAVL